MLFLIRNLGDTDLHVQILKVQDSFIIQAGLSTPRYFAGNDTLLSFFSNAPEHQAPNILFIVSYQHAS
jgi:hypothetical protein